MVSCTCLTVFSEELTNVFKILHDSLAYLLALQELCSSRQPGSLLANPDATTQETMRLAEAIAKLENKNTPGNRDAGRWVEPLVEQAWDIEQREDLQRRIDILKKVNIFKFPLCFFFSNDIYAIGLRDASEAPLTSSNDYYQFSESDGFGGQ